MADAMTGKKLALIGAGQMAEALLGGMSAAGAVTAGSVWATDVSAERRDLLKRRFGVRVGDDNGAAAAWADLVVLAVKPQIVDTVLRDLGDRLAGRLVVSIAAGVPIARIVRQIGPSVTPPPRVIRAMPNTPALVQAGMTAVALGPGVTEEDQAVADRLFESVGRVLTVEERLMDAVTGLSGSGPAYVFLAIEALADGGVKAGLPRGTANLLAAQTVLGAARMVLESGDHPAQLKDRVASPGGTTIAGLHQLEKGGLRATLIAAVEAAAKRSKELS